MLPRFPEDVMFQLTHDEAESVFTDYGAIQASNVLNSPQAIEMGVYIVRAFVQPRETIASNKELAEQLKALEFRMLRKFAAPSRHC